MAALAATPPAPPQLAVDARAKTGTQPKSVSVSPDGAIVAVCNFGRSETGNVSLLDDTTLEAVGTVDFAGTATESTWRSDTVVLVSDFAHGRLMAIDATSATVVDTIGVGPNPKGIALSPDGSTAFVTNWSGQNISVVDLDGGGTIQTLRTGRRPRGIAVLPDATVVVGAMWDHRLETFSPRSQRSTYLTDPSVRRVCSYPRDVELTPDGHWLVVSCSGNRRVRWFDAQTRRLVGQAHVGPNPRSLAVGSDGTWAAVANFHGDSVSMIDLVHGTATTTALPGADGVVGVAVHPGRARVVYATSWRTGEVLRLVPLQDTTEDPLGQRRLRKP